MLGHHYQREDIIQFADYRGDSFKLSQWAAERPESEYIVFCGVHFMAEAADILSAPHQRVMLPNMAAGCSMADMADPDDVYNAWAELEELGIAQDTLPITYMNSAASLKAFVGERGGAVCTSSNARKVLEWAFARKKRVLFFPDQHLGRNTGHAMGVPLDEMVLWGWARPYGSMGGQTLEALQRSRIILWAGHCSVHQRFTPRQIAEAREQHPDVTVIVHPECRLETVQASDLNGSTEFIARTITDAPAGSTFAVGTGDQPREPAGEGEPGQDRLLPRPGRLPLLDDVPRAPGVPRVDDGVARRRSRRERDRRAGRHQARREAGARPDAGDQVTDLPAGLPHMRCAD